MPPRTAPAPQTKQSKEAQRFIVRLPIVEVRLAQRIGRFAPLSLEKVKTIDVAIDVKVTGPRTQQGHVIPVAAGVGDQQIGAALEHLHETAYEAWLLSPFC